MVEAVLRRALFDRESKDITDCKGVSEKGSISRDRSRDSSLPHPVKESTAQQPRILAYLVIRVWGNADLVLFSGQFGRAVNYKVILIF
jgi:hypothetical protein